MDKFSHLKHPPYVILDIGTSYTKCGFAGTLHPHAFLKTPTEISRYMIAPDDAILYNLPQIVTSFLRHIFFSTLLVDPSHAASSIKMVAILENVLTMTSTFKRVVAAILDKKFWIESLVFIPSHLATIYCLMAIDYDVHDFTTIDLENSIAYNEIDKKDDIETPEFEGIDKGGDNWMSNLLGTTEHLESNLQRNHTNPDCLVVIDCGYSQITILPICSGLPILSAAVECPSYDIKTALSTQNKDENDPLEGVRNDEEYKQALKLFKDIRYVEDIASRVCMVADLKNSKQFDQSNSTFDFAPTDEDEAKFTPNDVLLNDYLCTTYMGDKLILKGWMRQAVCEIFFRPNIDGETLPTLILDSISRCSIDCRKALSQNLVLIGGLSTLPGFKNRLEQELKMLTLLCPTYNDKAYFKPLKLHRFFLPTNQSNTFPTYPSQSIENLEINSNSFHNKFVEYIKPNYASWSGASILLTSLNSFNFLVKPTTSVIPDNLLLSTFHKSKMASVFLNSNEGPLSRKIFSRKDRKETQDDYKKRAGGGMSCFDAIKPFIIKFEPRPLALNLAIRASQLKTKNDKDEVRIEGTDNNEELGESEDSEIYSKMAEIPDWNIIDTSIRPYWTS
ncbi:actin-related protein 10-like isoform X2 [Gordionus sp. m RMFG-2023]|uniref:actin-related protein 10-like isoform X2 n=1 Tax=Gordionus sp. m RMFG-2023 TaxID=3053472 RepID=UPI0031FD63C7